MRSGASGPTDMLLAAVAAVAAVAASVAAAVADAAAWQRFSSN